MAQVVSRRPLTAKGRVRTRVNPCGIYDGQSGSGIGFSPSSSVFARYFVTQPPVSAGVLNIYRAKGYIHHFLSTL
jgi:hypothetical protein